MARTSGYLREETIEASTLALLGDYCRKYPLAVQLPVPAEEIIEAHLGLTFDLADLPGLSKDPQLLVGPGFGERMVKIEHQKSFLRSRYLRAEGGRCGGEMLRLGHCRRREVGLEPSLDHRLSRQA